MVSIPSGLIASGFVDIVQSKARKGNPSRNVGDDWYDIKYRELEGETPPASMLGAGVDSLQQSVLLFLNGENNNGEVERSYISRVSRTVFFGLIISNVVAVMVESIPEVDRYVGNEKGNFFDVFEAVSVFLFTVGK